MEVDFVLELFGMCCRTFKKSEVLSSVVHAVGPASVTAPQSGAFPAGVSASRLEAGKPRVRVPADLGPDEGSSAWSADGTFPLCPYLAEREQALWCLL